MKKLSIYGELVTDADAGTFSVTVESAAARDLAGQRFDRRYGLDGDTRVLMPVDPTEGFGSIAGDVTVTVSDSE